MSTTFAALSSHVLFDYLPVWAVDDCDDVRTRRRVAKSAALRRSSVREAEARSVLAMYEPGTSHRMRRRPQDNCAQCDGQFHRSLDNCKAAIARADELECPCIAYCSLLPSTWREDFEDAIVWTLGSLCWHLEWIAVLGSCDDLRADDLTRVLGMDDLRLRELALHLMRLVPASSAATQET